MMILFIIVLVSSMITGILDIIFLSDVWQTIDQYKSTQMYENVTIRTNRTIIEKESYFSGMDAQNNYTAPNKNFCLFVQYKSRVCCFVSATYWPVWFCPSWYDTPPPHEISLGNSCSAFHVEFMWVFFGKVCLRNFILTRATT